MQGRQRGDAFLEQGLKGTHSRIAVKTAGEGVAMEEIGQRQEGHALVMGHVGLDDHPALAPLSAAVPLRLPAEIHGLKISVFAEQTQCGQPFHIFYGLARCQVQCQQRGIGRHHQLLFQAALQAEGRDAEGLVLIGSVEVKIGKGGLGYAPGHAVGAAIGHLDRHRLPGRLVEQRIGVGVLEQQRHQVFEHGSGPTEQHPLPADGAVGTAHGKPVFQGNIAPGDGDKAAEPGLTGQEVVTGLVEAIRGDIVTDSEQFALGSIEKLHVHPGRQLLDGNNELLYPSQGLTRQPLRFRKGRQQTVYPGGKPCIDWRRGLPQGRKDTDRIDPALCQGLERGRLQQVTTDGELHH